MSAHRLKLLCCLGVLVFCGCHPFEDTADHPFEGVDGVDNPQDTFDPSDGTTTDNPDSTTSDTQGSDTQDEDSFGDTIDTGDAPDLDDISDLDDVPDVVEPPVGVAIHVWSGRPDGAQGTGTREDPFLSLTDALVLANEKLSASPSEQILIFLAQGHYSVPAELLGDPEAFSTSINFTGIHFFGGFPTAADGAGVLWEAVVEDAANSAIKLKSPSEPMVFRPREALIGFEGTTLSHVAIFPDPGLLDVLPSGERVMVHAIDTTVKLSRSSVEVGLSLGFSVGLLVDSVEGRQGMLVLEDSEVYFPQSISDTELLSLYWLVGVKTHGGVIRFVRSRVAFETPALGDIGSSFEGIAGIYATEAGSRVEMLQSRISTGYALWQSVGLHCEQGCDLNISSSNIQAIGRNPEGRITDAAVGVSLVHAGQVLIANSRVNLLDEGGAPTCGAQFCLGVLVNGSHALPDAAVLAVGPQPSADGPMTNCDPNFFDVVVEGSRIGGGNAMNAIALEIRTNEDGDGGFPPLVCVNASRMDAGRCLVNASQGVDAHCRGIRMLYPLAAIIHNSIIYGGEATSKSAAVEISVGGVYRNVVLASNLLHGGTSSTGASAAVLLAPSVPAQLNNEGDLSSGVIIVGNDLYPGQSPELPFGIEELPPYDPSLVSLVPLAVISNAFHGLVGSAPEYVAYKHIEAAQPINYMSAEELNSTIQGSDIYLNQSLFCSDFSPVSFREQPAYSPVTSPGNPCQNAGIPYSVICSSANPPNGVIGWLPWADINYKPRVCNTLACNVPTTGCNERWSGDHAPDIGPFESEGSACVCSQ